MKYGLEEFRIGRWERIGNRPFESWKEADSFVDRLRDVFPFRQVRIVPFEDETSETAS